MGLETAAIIGISTALASAGASAGQAVSAGQAARNASSRATKAFDEAMQKLSANQFAGIGLPMEVRDRQIEANLAAGAEATQQAAEGEGRGVAATAGQIYRGQTEAQRNIAGDIGQQLMGLETATAQEEARLSQARANLNLAEAEGAQQAAAQAGAQQAAAVKGIFTGLESAGQQYMEGSELYKANEGTKELANLKKEYETAVKKGSVGSRFKDAQGNVLAFEDILPRLQAPNVELSGLQGLQGTQITDYFVKRPSVTKSLLGMSFMDNTPFQQSLAQPATSTNKFMPSASGVNPSLRFNTNPFGL
jgi:hypothetical protein